MNDPTGLSHDELARRILGLPPHLQQEATRHVADLYGQSGPVARPHTEYQTRPLEWMTDKLSVDERTLKWSLNDDYGGHRWDGTTEPLVAIVEALSSGEDVGVESGTGTGKTFLGACVVLWFLACWEDAIVVTAAPKQDQLLKHIWKEIGRLWPRFKKHFPEAVLTSGHIAMRPGTEEKETWAATAFVCGVGADESSATKAQGFHAEHMLIVTEETPGIHPAIMTAFENTSTAPHNLRLALGNPDHQHDELHRFCVQPFVRHVRISALDHPNVVTGDGTIVPGAVGLEAVERRADRYGRGSRLYDSRVRGISPAEAEDALIKWEWCEEAAERYGEPELRNGLSALGVDVANSANGDKAAIARGIGGCLTDVSSFQCPDALQLGNRVSTEMNAQGVNRAHVGVDSVGVGAATVNQLKALGTQVRALNGGASAVSHIDWDLGRIAQEEEFNNLRSQMWWQLRMDLQHGRIALPHDTELFNDLTAATWLTRNGKIVVEPKEKIRERLGRSTDKGDAVVYWNWVRRRKPLPEPEPEIPDREHYDEHWDEFVRQHQRATRRSGQRASIPQGRGFSF